MTKHCTTCDAELYEAWEYCPMCGAAVPVAATGETTRLTWPTEQRIIPPWGDAKIGGTGAYHGGTAAPYHGGSALFDPRFDLNYGGILGGTVPPEVKP
jgi:hypothetical protein